MKKLILILALALVSTGAWGVNVEVPLSYDNAWQKAVQTIALEGIGLSVMDKHTGVFQGSESFDRNSKYFVCPPLSGVAYSYTYTIAVTIQAKDESSSIVSIQAMGSRKSYRSKKAIMITIGRVHTEDKCLSTGVLEASLLNSLSGFETAQSFQTYEPLIEQLQSSSQVERTNASKYIYGAGIDDAELYEAVATAIRKKLAILDRKSPKTLQQEMAWHAKALASSGNQDYLPLLDELSRSTARTVAKHAKKSKKLLTESANSK